MALITTADLAEAIAGLSIGASTQVTTTQATSIIASWEALAASRVASKGFASSSLDDATSPIRAHWRTIVLYRSAAQIARAMGNAQVDRLESLERRADTLEREWMEQAPTIAASAAQSGAGSWVTYRQPGDSASVDPLTQMVRHGEI